ncbi:MAG: sulfatase-like hydrolase/transferase [Actinobacteria bacterium]|nr:sulfatase-like hydrolase/transferase [Actinomycetota bacterium]
MGDAEEQGTAAGARGGRRAPAIAGLATAVTVGTLTHPVLELLGANAEFFVARAQPRRDAVLVAAVLAVLVPAAVWAVTFLVGRRSPGAATGVAALVGAAGAAATVARLAPAAPLPAALAGGAVGAVVVVLVARSPTSWPVARWGAAVPVASLLLFVAVLPVRTIVWPTAAAVDTSEAADRPVPVVVLIFDELPLASLLSGPETIDARRFPNVAALVAESVWYRNATTVTDRTSHAVPAILTGERPARDSLPVAAHHPRSLFSLLAPTHDVHAVEPATALCPPDVCGSGGTTSGSAPAGAAALWRDVRTVAGHVLLPEAWTAGLAPVDQAWGGFSGAQPEADFDLSERAMAASTGDRRNELRGVVRPAGERPPAYVLHTMLPHVPYRYLPSGQELLPAPLQGLTDEGMWVGDAWQRDHAQRLHLLQAGLADRILGEVLDDLRDAGLYEQAIIAVVSDHGVAFRGDTHRRRVERRTLPDIAAVPLIVRYPSGPRGVVDERPVETIDLVPTIAEALGLELGPVAGTALTSRAPRPPERVIDAFDGPFSFLPHEADPWEVAEDRRTRMGPGWAGVYATVDGEELIGRPVAELSPGPSPVMLATVDHREALRRFHPRSDPIAGVLTGGLAFAEPPEAPVRVAVVFDGTVVAVGRSTVPEGDTAAYEALLDPRRYRDGVDRVDVYLVDDDGRLWGPLLDPGQADAP